MVRPSSHSPHRVLADRIGNLPAAQASGGVVGGSIRTEPLAHERTVSVARRGFTLVEFLVVISIVVLLTGILMPSLARARDAADRMRCANNLRQIGGALVGYFDDSADRLPTLMAATLASPRYSEGMALTTPDGQRLEGLGHLLRCASTGGYLPDARLLYCPCHRGEHPFERYQTQIGGMFLDSETLSPAYANYHYRGHLEKVGTGAGPGSSRRVVDPMRSDRLLVVDGMRLKSDINHVRGTNRLFGDGHVDWRNDSGNEMRELIPSVTSLVEPAQLYTDLWKTLETDDYKR